MSEIKLSVSVAIYNIEKYLPKCLESLMNQTQKEGYEILLINDGSTDNSLEICKQYIEKGLQAKLITKQNEGIASVRNLSIRESKGKYILMIDGDDYLSENTIEILFRNLDDEFDMIAFGFEWKYKSKSLRDERFNKEKIYDKDLKMIIFKNELNTAVWNKVFKRDIILQNNIFVPELNGAEDYLFVYEYLKKCKKVKKIEKVLYYYYQRENGLSRDKSLKFYENNFKVLLELLNKEQKIEIKDYVLSNYIYLVREYIKKSEKSREIKSLLKKIEEKIDLKYLLFKSNVRLKMKIRYLKVKGRY